MILTVWINIAVLSVNASGDTPTTYPTLIEHPIESGHPPIYLDGDDWTATQTPSKSGTALASYFEFKGQLPTNRNNFTDSLTGLDLCATTCNISEACVGFTTDEGRTMCWLYNNVPSLTIDGAEGDSYFAKPNRVPPHTPAPPLPPPPPPPPPPPTVPTIKASVPGDILTDLQRAGTLPDPYFNSTWRNPAFFNTWNSGTWEYKKIFVTPITSMPVRYLLVFDGIRMGAKIQLNGVLLGNAVNQFRRFVYVLNGTMLKPSGGENTLSVVFGAELEIDTEGRYTHSNQIDWAPVMPTTDPMSCKHAGGCRSTFGFGIWKSVYLLPVGLGSAAITEFVIHTDYAGGHPTSILNDSNHAGFDIKARISVFTPTTCSGTASVSGSWPGAKPVSSKISLNAGNSTIALQVSHEQTIGVRLWHPHGHGGQPLYNISAMIDCPNMETSTATRRVGFRHIALVTVNDTDPYVAGNAAKTNGTSSHTMFFRVNGAVVYARGGNKVPMDLLDGRLSANATRRLVQSAAEGNMNTLRVWGGGIWEPRAFWDACDEFGILLYTDMQFTWGFISGTENEKLEIEYQVQRLSHHPSIAMWDGCNECGGGGLYESFVMPTVASLDNSRPIWPSCPAPGWISGVDGLTSRPNGQVLVMGERVPRILFPFPQESHGPYTAFMKQNVEGVVMAKAQPLPESQTNTNDPRAVPAWTGPKYEGWYKSEFGCVAWSSFESMSSEMPPDQWSMSSPGAKDRNWNASNVIGAFFGVTATVEMGRYGESAFKKQLYQSMISQALFLKTEIEAWRSQNVFGTTIWMYNEMWPTGGWGSIEYGSPVPGQVAGGRWKPLHYIFKSSTFADQLCTCNTGGACFITNDSPFPFAGSINIRLVNLLSGHSEPMGMRNVTLPEGAGITDWFCADTMHLSNRRTEKLPLHYPHGAYTKHPYQIPVDRPNYTEHDGETEAECEAICNSNSSCVGFTMLAGSTIGTCWTYIDVPELMNFAGGDWYQKPGTNPIPAPPSPPPPPEPPSQLSCIRWVNILAWKSAGCDENGTNCVLVIEVHDDEKSVSRNVQPFVAPKFMRVPDASIEITVGEPNGMNEIPISLLSNASAIFVVLTTAAAGRFSENVLLLEKNQPHSMTFIPWESFDYSLLKSSLRVEHLADNLS